MASDHLLTAADVAELLSVPVSWVREHTRSGRIPHVQLGRYVRYREQTLVSWVAEQEAGSFRRHRPRIPTS
jgi:excisionase family DNA binding protein